VGHPASLTAAGPGGQPLHPFHRRDALPHMAPTNKCLAQNNKSCTRANATKNQSGAGGNRQEPISGRPAGARVTKYCIR
jgi:hypothetical protein